MPERGLVIHTMKKWGSLKLNVGQGISLYIGYLYLYIEDRLCENYMVVIMSLVAVVQ